MIAALVVAASVNAMAQGNGLAGINEAYLSGIKQTAVQNAGAHGIIFHFNTSLKRVVTSIIIQRSIFASSFYYFVNLS